MKSSIIHENTWYGFLDLRNIQPVSQQKSEDNQIHTWLIFFQNWTTFWMKFLIFIFRWLLLGLQYSIVFWWILSRLWQPIGMVDFCRFFGKKIILELFFIELLLKIINLFSKILGRRQFWCVFWRLFLRSYRSQTWITLPIVGFERFYTPVSSICLPHFVFRGKLHPAAQSACRGVLEPSCCKKQQKKYQPRNWFGE